MSNLLLQRMREQLQDKYLHEFKLMDFKEENGEIVEAGEVVLFGLKDNFFFGDVLRQVSDLKKLANKKQDERAIFDLIDAIEKYVKSAFTFEDFIKAINEKMSETFVNTISMLTEQEQAEYLKREYENLLHADITTEWVHKVIEKVQVKNSTKKQKPKTLK
jgi:hypothetical protein